MILYRTRILSRIIGANKLFTNNKIKTNDSIHSCNMTFPVLSFGFCSIGSKLTESDYKNNEGDQILALLNQFKAYSSLLQIKQQNKQHYTNNLSKFLSISCQINKSIDKMKNIHLFQFVSQIAKHRSILKNKPQFIKIRQQITNQTMKRQSKQMKLLKFLKITRSIKQLYDKQWDQLFTKWVKQFDFKQFQQQLEDSIPLNQLCVMYDVLSFNYRTNRTYQLQIPKQIFQNLKIFKQKIASSILSKIDKSQYYMHYIMIFLKNYSRQSIVSKESSNIGLQVNRIVLQQYNLGKKQIKVIIDCTSILEMFILLPGYMNLKQSILDNHIYPFMLKSSSKIKKQDQSTGEQVQMLIIKNIYIQQINIFMASFTRQHLWNPDIFKLLQDNFFYLLEINHIRDPKNIEIYCQWRANLCKNIVKNIIKDEDSKQQEDSTTQNTSNTPARIQQIKKTHIQFMIKLFSLIKNKYADEYSLSTITGILQHCKKFRISSRKVDKLVKQIQNIKLKQS